MKLAWYILSAYVLIAIYRHCTIVTVSTYLVMDLSTWETLQ